MRQGDGYIIFALMNRTQCRMARAALEWSGVDLAKASGVSARTVAKFELGESVSADTVEALRSAFAREGIEFHSGEARLGVSYRRGNS